MDRDDAELLAHYLARGAEPWNGSLEAAWLDYELRAWVAPVLAARRPTAVCNVGIGVGLWDDWLGHTLARSITSIDRDAELCRMLALRQRRERHPYPAHVVCGDAIAVLGGPRWQLITVVGSTLAEAGAEAVDGAAALERAALAALTADGVLLVATVGTGEPPHADHVRRRDELWLACRVAR